MVADVYEANKRYPEAKKILLMAYDRSSIGKGILYRLVEVSVKMKDFDEAIDFYNEFEAVARHDNSRYLLKYKILRGQKAPLEEQISLLEEYKEREFTERWAYELANLYSKAGETQKCIDACDELILWFSEGKYVTKAMDLKMKYEPLSPSQQIKYEHRFDYKKNEEPSEDPEALKVRLAGESGAGEMAATKEPAETPEVKPVNGGVMSQYVAGEEEKKPVRRTKHMRKHSRPRQMQSRCRSTKHCSRQRSRSRRFRKSRRMQTARRRTLEIRSIFTQSLQRASAMSSPSAERNRKRRQSRKRQAKSRYSTK